MVEAKNEEWTAEIFADGNITNISHSFASIQGVVDGFYDRLTTVYSHRTCVLAPHNCSVIEDTSKDATNM